MQKKALDDEVVMNLVEAALARPAAEREAYLAHACAGDSELLETVTNYVQSEARMNGFLLEPLFSPGAQEHPFQPGELLDNRFRIIREVAHGGMGIVYEAMDEKLERRIALKCAKAAFRQRLPPEVRLATEISHPNVCKIFEIHTAVTRFGEIDFLTMEFLEGETLSERLSHGMLPEGEGSTIARQLCEGLAEAHRNQVIHGDLKSNNVILTKASDGTTRAVITDFGLARGLGALLGKPQSEGAAGTPGYMAPELLRGEKPSVKSDIYALGVILYELACGRRPHRDEPGAELTWEERLSRRPPAANTKWDRILARCLDPDPSQRYPDVEKVAQALAPPRSQRWLLGAIAAAIVAVVSGVVSYQRATAPAESVRLAMLPLTSDPGNARLADDLSRSTAGQLAQLKGSAHTKLTVIPFPNAVRGHVDTPEKARTLLAATHVLHASLEKENQKTILHAYLTNAQSLVNVKEWKAEYTAGETRYIPVALAGMVTGTLRLPPLAIGTVNAAARQDYQNGLSYVRRDSGVSAAVAFLERAVAADPDSPLTQAAQAEAQWFKYFLTRDKVWLDRATESVRQAEIRNPDLASVHRIAGKLKENDGRYEQAAEDYRRAIELEPRNGDAYRRLGQVYERNNQPDEALAEYRRALDVEPQYYRTYQALGNSYFIKANYSEAAKYLTKAVELAPDEPAARFALGSALTNLGRFADAESEFRFAIHLQETPHVLYELGRALMYQRRDQEAIPHLQAALNLSPQAFIIWTELGNAYRRTNQPAEALRANRRGLDLAEAEMARNPRDSETRSFVAYLCARLGDRRRAESEIAQALRLSPNIQDVAAVTYEALGLRDSTLAVLSAAPAEMLADVSRWPDLADLHKDPRFLQLLASHQLK
jgi:serine/threonine protein kinase/cytochrome c-type biogenesis protein CcmH/NrfG